MSQRILHPRQFGFSPRRKTAVLPAPIEGQLIVSPVVQAERWIRDNEIDTFTRKGVRPQGISYPNYGGLTLRCEHQPDLCDAGCRRIEILTENPYVATGTSCLHQQRSRPTGEVHDVGNWPARARGAVGGIG